MGVVGLWSSASNTRLIIGLSSGGCGLDTSGGCDLDTSGGCGLDTSGGCGLGTSVFGISIGILSGRGLGSVGGGFADCIVGGSLIG